MRSIIILLLAASFATAGTPDRAAWKKAWYRARRSESQVAFPTNGLVSYWSMDSVSGTTVFDTWGSNDGTAVGTPLFDAAYGKYLDGVNLIAASSQRINLGTSQIGNTFPVTYSAWVKSADYSSATQIITFGNSGSDLPFIIFGTDSGGVRYLIRNDAQTFFRRIDSNETLTNGEWYHVAVVVSGVVDTDDIELYVNGQKRTNNVIVNTGSTLGAVTLNTANIGALQRTSILYSTCNLDEIAIFNRALSSNEVSTIYNNGTGRFYTP